MFNIIIIVILYLLFYVNN